MWQTEPGVVSFLEAAKAAAGGRPRRVIELGSFAMHDHDPRPLFQGAEYVGVDARPGPGVDVVALAHQAALEPADLVLSISALEHDPYWPATLSAAARLAKPGGVVAVTCAGPGWKEHELDCAPDPGWYKNVSSAEILATLLTSLQTFGRHVERAEGWYIPRSCAPHWPRSCVLVRVGQTG